jgi:hypothetical protein
MPLLSTLHATIATFQADSKQYHQQQHCFCLKYYLTPILLPQVFNLTLYSAVPPLLFQAILQAAHHLCQL